MKNIKHMVIIFVLAIVTFTGLRIYLSVALHDEKLELTDISGDRSALTDFRITGRLSNGFFHIDFIIENGHFTKRYRLLGDSGIDVEPTTTFLMSHFDEDSMNYTMRLSTTHKNGKTLFLSRGPLDSTMSIVITTNYENQEQIEESRVLYKGLLDASAQVVKWQTFDDEGNLMRNIYRADTFLFDIEVN